MAIRSFYNGFNGFTTTTIFNYEESLAQNVEFHKSKMFNDKFKRWNGGMPYTVFYLMDCCIGTIFCIISVV